MGQFLSGVSQIPSSDDASSASQSTPKNVRSTVDPRSPTLEFDRTPVRVESTPQCGKRGGAAAVAGGGGAEENMLQLQRALDTTPTTARERPRTLHQKMVAEKHKKMTAEQQQPPATPISS